MEYLIIFVPLILIGVVLISASNKRKAIEQALYRYQEALKDLKKHPADPNKKQNTLMLGRAYSNLTRNKRGVTIFDEMALMNDLNAATAAAHTSPARAASVSYVPPATPVVAISAPTTAERLRKLDDLKTQGLINEQEYTDRRTVILNDV